MYLAITVTAAVLPSLLLIWYFYSKDENPEPRGVLITTFFLGVLIVIPVVIVALPIMIYVVPLLVVPESPNRAFVAGLGLAFLTAGIPEEFFKWVVLVFYCARHKEFDEPMDGIVYGVVASLGFATMENVLYVTQGGLGLAIARALTAVPCHAFLGAIMGYFVGRARFNRTGSSAMLYFLSLAIPMFLHGLYDFPLMVLNEQGGKEGPLDLALIGMSFATLIAMGLLAWYLVRSMRAEQLTLKGVGTP